MLRLTYDVKFVNTLTDGKYAQNLQSHKDLAIVMQGYSRKLASPRSLVQRVNNSQTAKDKSLAELLINRMGFLKRSNITVEEPCCESYVLLLHAIKLTQHMAFSYIRKINKVE